MGSSRRACSMRSVCPSESSLTACHPQGADGLARELGQSGRDFRGAAVPEESRAGVVFCGRPRRRAAPLATDRVGFPGASEAAAEADVSREIGLVGIQHGDCVDIRKHASRSGNPSRRVQCAGTQYQGKIPCLKLTSRPLSSGLSDVITLAYFSPRSYLLPLVSELEARHTTANSGHAPTFTRPQQRQMTTKSGRSAFCV